MFTRISSALALVVLAACNRAGTSPIADQPGDSIECALAGAAGFKRECTVERVRGTGAGVLVIRHPDGGFRRLLESGDGSFETADGAQRAVVTPGPGYAGVAVGQDRYRLPERRPVSGGY